MIITFTQIRLLERFSLLFFFSLRFFICYISECSESACSLCLVTSHLNKTVRKVRIFPICARVCVHFYIIVLCTKYVEYCWLQLFNFYFYSVFVSCTWLSPKWILPIFINVRIFLLSIFKSNLKIKLIHFEPKLCAGLPVIFFRVTHKYNFILTTSLGFEDSFSVLM